MTDKSPIQESDLPIWMRKALRPPDYGFFLTVGFALIIGWYFITGPALPSLNSTENTVFLVSDYADSFREGRFYPRWSPHANNGYGAPIAHFTPPTVPYLAALIEVLFTGDSVAAVRMVHLIAIIAGALGSYGLARRHTGVKVALVAAILYITSPYFGLIAPHLLGNLQDTAALGILPLLMWSLDRLHTLNYRQDFPISVALSALLILTHPTIAIVAACFILLALQWQRKNEHETHTSLALLALSTGGLMAAFYWLPALHDIRTVTWQTQTLLDAGYQLSWQDLFLPYRQHDPLTLTPHIVFTFGWLRWILIGISLGVMLRNPNKLSFSGLNLVIGLSLTLFGVWITPDIIWLIGLAQLFTSLSIGHVFEVIPTRTAQQERLFAVIITLVVLGTSASAWLPPDPTPSITNTQPLAQVQHEQRNYGVATVPKGANYPSTLSPNLPSNQALLQSYEQGVILRYAPSILSRGLQISQLQLTAHSARYQIQTTQSRAIPILLARFSGWQARTTQQWQPVGSQRETGLVVLDIPAPVNTTVQIRLGATPLRRAAWIISGLGLLLTGFITQKRDVNQRYHDYKLLTKEEARLFVVALILFSCVIILAASPNATLSPRPKPYSGLSTFTPIEVLNSSGANLIGYQLNTQTDYAEVTLVWEASRNIQRAYYPLVTLTHTTTNSATYQAPLHHPGYIPTSRWPVGRYVVDAHHITLPHDAPNGDYDISIALMPCPQTTCDELGTTFFTPEFGAVGSQYIIQTKLNVKKDA